VETREQLDYLQSRNCDEGQGYYFSYPVVANQFAKLLETGISTTILN
jgi:EAL domain-containing protein (putative c-di-GMP-specific phosphodiesterase class I)